MRRNVTLLFFILLSFGCSFAQPNQRPNIILIYTDQHRYDALGAYGNKSIKTPHLDQLAASGVYFPEAFVTAPVCTPSRWSLLSGMYTTSHQSYSNHHPGVPPPTSLPLELKNAGYANALIGKNHSFAGAREFALIRDVPRKESKRMATAAAPWPVEEDPMHALTNYALDFMAGNAGREQPFFIWLSYLYPHTPYEVPEPYFSRYKEARIPPLRTEKDGLTAANKPFRQVFHQENNDRLLPFNAQQVDLMRKTYYGMVTLVDDEVKRITDFLRANNLDSNTIIVFTSDHGDYQGDHGMFTKSPALYDCLVRVPLIFSWPGKIAGNVRSDQLISQVDIMPTLLSLAGLPVPEQVQGIDIADYLRKGTAQKPVRQAVFAEYGIPGKPFDRARLAQVFPDYQEKPIAFAAGIPWEANPVSLAGRFRMIRTHEWKYIHNPGEKDELYHLKKDPHELKNLAGRKKYAGVQAQLKAALTTWKNALPAVERDQEDIVDDFIRNFATKRRKND